jgi:SOS response regulatory protein OraA/RecX
VPDAVSPDAMSPDAMSPDAMSPNAMSPNAVPPGPGEAERAVDHAVRALARRDHSTASLRRKLDRAGVSESAQAAALDVLGRAGYVDDGRFAADRAVVLAQRGYGDAWIRADLERQGVERGVAESAVAVLEAEPERARREAARAGGGLRAVQFLGRRGFSEDALEAVASTVVADDAAEGVG